MLHRRQVVRIGYSAGGNEQTTVEEVPDMLDFREMVDGIPKRRDAILIKVLYLTASWVSEVVTRCTPWDLRRNATHAYGAWMQTGFADFEHTVFRNGEPRVLTEKVFLITQAVARRRAKSKKDPNSKSYKIIGLPTSQHYEPWTLDLLKYKQSTGKLSFDLQRKRVWEIVKENLSDLDPSVRPHSLRLWRLDHLVTEYGVDAYVELPFIAGRSFGNVFAAGSRPSSAAMLDIFLHGQWRSYFPKLLRPMSYHAIRPDKAPREEIDPKLLEALQEIFTTEETLDERVKRLKGSDELVRAFLRLAKEDPGKASSLLGIPAKGQDVSTKTKTVDEIAEEEEYR